MLAVLTLCPMRAKNMAAMAIGTTLQWRGNEWWTTFGPADMKNRRAFESPLPGLTALIDSYLERYRPVLVARSTPPIAGNALWISVTGKRLSPKQIGQIVSRRTERELGHDLNPHLFRKLVPTELAIHDPEHVGVAPDSDRQSGHASLRLSAKSATSRAHSMTASAVASSVCGTLRPNAFAVLRFMTSSYFVGACTCRSAAFSPLRTRST